MNKEKKHIFFLSASDRINYGDLLFPIIFKEFLKGSDYIFHNYGIVSTNFKDFGALPTLSYAQMLADLKKYSGKLVIGGGEVLFPDWETLFAFINSTYARLREVDFFTKVERRLQIAKKLLGGSKVALPFSPNPGELKQQSVKIFYSSVGGQFYGDLSSKKNKLALKAMQGATYISVRDERSKDSLHAMGVDAALVPDSALLMSDYFSINSLKANSSIDSKFYEGDYLFLQLGRFKGPQNLKLFSEKLEVVSKSLKLKVILCPIGLAPGHEDDVILKQLAALNTDFTFIMPKSISDIMLLIASSKFYLGTSLHGLITAQSFNVPHLPLNKNIGKAVSYLQTWVDTSLKAADFTDDEYIIQTFNAWDTTAINKKTILQKKMVRHNLQLIVDHGER